MSTVAAGLDIGANSIKAVLLSRGGAEGGRVLAAEAVSIGAEGGLEPALKKLAQTKIFQKATSCICLSLNQVMLRHVTLPFRDDHKIRKALPFELEALIPLSKGDILSDYLKHEEGRLLVAVAAKKDLHDLVGQIESILETEVAVVDVSLGALAYPVMEKSIVDECALLLDVGARNTGACFCEDGAIVQMRENAFGGDVITGALAREKKMPEENALSFLRSASPDEAGVGVCQACRDFCREIKNTVEIMKLNGTLKKEVSRIALSGGGAAFPVLIDELENCFSVPVEILDVAALNKIEIGQNILEKYQPQIMNTAVAAALRLLSQKRGFNFRKGEFAPRGARFDSRSGLRRAAIVVLIIVFMGFANLCGGWALQAYRAGVIKKQMALIFKKNYPEAQATVDPLQQLKTKLAADKKTFGFYGAGQGATVADILKEISVLIPAAAGMVLTEFSCENGVVMMSGQATNIDKVSAAKNELMKSRYFQDVDIASSSLTKDGDEVQFSMRIALK